MKQFWYTDNLKGHGLSVLSHSKGLANDFLTAIDAYCGYLRSSDGCNGDGQRYNLSFAGEGMPVLMNSVYIGKEVTSQRNGNFLTHAVLSKAPLNGYATDYFLQKGFFCRALPEDEARKMDPKPLGDIGDSGVRTSEKERREDLEWTVEAVNRDPDFYRNLLQATLFTLKNGGHIRLFGFGDAVGDRQAIRVVRALTHFFPVNVANRITFNTRANYYEPPRSCYLRVIDGEGERKAAFGSVEILQFYDASRASCGTEGCNYYFYRNNEAVSTRFERFLPFVRKLIPEGGTSADLIGEVYRWFRERDLDAEENSDKAIAAVTREDWDLSLIIPLERVETAQLSMASDLKRTERGGKKNKIVILSCIVSLILLAAVGLTTFFLINKTPVPDVDAPPSGQTDPPAAEQYFTVVYPDGKAARFRIGEGIVLEVPDARLGYEFQGYRDGQGKTFTDANGAVRSDYTIAADSRLELSAIWQAKQNKLTVSCGTEKFEFTCATDETISFSEKLFSDILKIYPHMRITGFALDSAEGTKVCTVNGDRIEWTEGYGVFSEQRYRSQLESGTPLVLVPLTEYLSYPVIFYDYVTKAALDSMEILYNELIPTDKKYGDNFYGGKYYLYLKKGTEFIKVYNENDDGRWKDGYDRLSGYDEVLDADGEIGLYVSGNVRLRIQNKAQVDVEPGSDIFALCEDLTKNEEIQSVNSIFIGNDRSRSAGSNDAFWQIIREQDMTNAIKVTPAYKAVFTFGYNQDRTELAQDGVALTRSVVYLYFTGGEYLYEGNTMSEITAALTEKASDVHTPKGVVCADLIRNLWMPTPASTDASYTVFEGYVLEKGARITGYFNGDGDYKGGADALVSDGSERCLYSVYDPREVTVSFQGLAAPYTTAYGGDLNWTQLNERSRSYSPRWGTYLISWAAADGKLKESGEESVTRDALDVYGVRQNGSALSIEFVPTLGNYKFEFYISYGGKTNSSQSLTVDKTVSFDKAAIERLYPVEHYSTPWNQGWTIGGKTFTPAESMVINEGNFGRFVDLGSAANHVVTINITKGEPMKRTYTIRTEQNAYTNGGNSELRYSIGISATESITYQGSMSLGKCASFEAGILDRVQYVFDGWYVGDTRITDADGVINDFDALYALAQNDVITVRAVFKTV